MPEVSDKADLSFPTLSELLNNTLKLMMHRKVYWSFAARHSLYQQGLRDHGEGKIFKGFSSLNTV
jgi:hypothetical protein